MFRLALAALSVLASTTIPAAHAGGTGAGDCRPIAVRTAGRALAVGVVESCPGVRPGAVVRTGLHTLVGDGAICTFNFLVADVRSGDLFAGTAGHCVLEGTGVSETAFAQGSAAAALPHWAHDVDDRDIGAFAYAVFDGLRDFALIKLNATGRAEANPAMCHFGGPASLRTSTTSATTVLRHFGNGTGFSSLAPARTAVAFGMPDPDVAFVEGVTMTGDSGSPIIDSDGGAVGVIVAIAANANPARDVNAGPVMVTRLAPQLARASLVLRRSLALRTAPLV